MADRTAIEWTDATVNFWWGCTKVGPGCDHCYAESWSKRTGHAVWGPGAARRKIKGAVKLLHRLDNDYSWWAADMVIGSGQRFRPRNVFIQSMADFFDNEVPIEWFTEAWKTICACDRVAIQIVTKRISMVEKRLAAVGATQWPQHAGLMITVVNQAEADRDIPRLLALKAKLGIPWVGLSMEPLLEPVDLFDLKPNDFVTIDALGGRSISRDGDYDDDLPRLDWVIVGGESGPGARVWAGFTDAARSLRDQCKANGTAFFMKQMAGVRKASMPAIPDDLMIREFPHG
jgi:protein gp37